MPSLNKETKAFCKCRLDIFFFHLLIVRAYSLVYFDRKASTSANFQPVIIPRLRILDLFIIMFQRNKTFSVLIISLLPPLRGQSTAQNHPRWQPSQMATNPLRDDIPLRTDKMPDFLGSQYSYTISRFFIAYSSRCMYF